MTVRIPGGSGERLRKFAEAAKAFARVSLGAAMLFGGFSLVLHYGESIGGFLSTVSIFAGCFGFVVLTDDY